MFGVQMLVFRSRRIGQARHSSPNCNFNNFALGTPSERSYQRRAESTTLDQARVRDSSIPSPKSQQLLVEHED